MNEQTATIESRIITRAMQDDSFRQQLLGGSVAAKAAIESELGQKLPEGLEIKVLEETADASYLVLPKAIGGDGELSESELETVAGGFLPCMFGSITFTFGPGK